MFAAAISSHPDPAVAAGEVIGQVHERLGGRPDLAAVFVTAPLVGSLGQLVDAVHAVLAPTCLVGASASAVAAEGTAVEGAPAVALWAGRVPARPVRLVADRGRPVWVDPPADVAAGACLVLLADPFTFPVGELLDAHPHLPVVGGLASAAAHPGGNRLVLDDRLVADGAVGVLIDPPVAPTPVVSPGCRPVGRPFTVTRAERNVVLELGGQRAYDRVVALLEGLGPEDRALAARGLHCGLAVDEHEPDLRPGDFLIRNLLDADAEAGTITVGDDVPVGTTFQLQVRDPATAGDDLHQRLAPLAATAGGALLFTCNGRGRAMFGTPHHDVARVRDTLGVPVAGLACAGEIGPVAGRSVLHGFTAAVAVFPAVAAAGGRSP